MSFTIIVKSGSSNRFKPHMNHAIGKFIHTKDDYLKSMKSMNLIPQSEAKKIAEQKQKEANKQYKPSKWARDMAKVVSRKSVGSSFYSELEKKGYGPDKIKIMNKKSKEANKILNKGKDGFYND